MDKTTFLGNVTVIDGFASTGLEAVLIDKDWYMVYDQLHKMRTIYNPEGLYWQYNYHVWQVLSVSRFANAVAFVSGDIAPVTQVIVDPTIASIKQGRTHKFKAYVRENDGVERDVVWSLEGTNGSTVQGSTIDDNGVVTIGAEQEGELLVKATVTYETGSGESVEEHEVVGESILTVIPNQ